MGIDQFHAVTLDQKKFPELTKDLRTAMYEESAMLFDTILRDDRSMTEFVDNDYTFMNNALAKIYGMASAVNKDFDKCSRAHQTTID